MSMAPLGAMLCGGAATVLVLITLTQLGSLTYPLAYAQVLIGLIALLFFGTAALSWREARATQPAAPAHGSSGGGGWVMTGTILLCVLYAAAWTWIGYFPATLVFVVAQLWLLGERRWWLILLLAGGATLLVYGVFDRLLLLPFPGGRLFGDD